MKKVKFIFSVFFITVLCMGKMNAQIAPAIQKITSNQVINTGNTIYKAKEIELNNDFEVKSGAEFEIIIDDNGCP